MLANSESHTHWLVCAKVCNPPHMQFALRQPIWSDMTSVDIMTQWKDWQSASVVNQVLIPRKWVIQQPGFDLPHCSRSLLHHFRTGEGSRQGNLHRWGGGLCRSDLCRCGQWQSISHTVDSNRDTRQGDGLQQLRRRHSLVVGIGGKTSTREMENAHMIVHDKNDRDTHNAPVEWF